MNELKIVYPVSNRYNNNNNVNGDDILRSARYTLESMNNFINISYDTVTPSEEGIDNVLTTIKDDIAYRFFRAARPDKMIGEDIRELHNIRDDINDSEKTYLEYKHGLVPVTRGMMLELPEYVENLINIYELTGNKVIDTMNDMLEITGKILANKAYIKVMKPGKTFSSVNKDLKKANKILIDSINGNGTYDSLPISRVAKKGSDIEDSLYDLLGFYGKRIDSISYVVRNISNMSDKITDRMNTIIENIEKAYIDMPANKKNELVNALDTVANIMNMTGNSLVMFQDMTATYREISLRMNGQ